MGDDGANRAEMYGHMIAMSVAYHEDAVLIIRVKLSPPDPEGIHLVDWDSAAMMPEHYNEELLAGTVRKWLERAEADKDPNAG